MRNLCPDTKTHSGSAYGWPIRARSAGPAFDTFIHQYIPVLRDAYQFALGEQNPMEVRPPPPSS